MFFQKSEAEPERNQGRYNLRRRKDDADTKPAETKPEQPETAKVAAAPAATLCTSLDFGGKIGRFQDRHKMQLHVTPVIHWF